MKFRKSYYTTPGVSLGVSKCYCFYVKVFLCDGQGADRRAILSSDRSCFEIDVAEIIKGLTFGLLETCEIIGAAMARYWAPVLLKCSTDFEIDAAEFRKGYQRPVKYPKVLKYWDT